MTMWVILHFLFPDSTAEAQSAAASSAEKERAMREQYAELAATSAAFQAQVRFAWYRDSKLLLYCIVELRKQNDTIVIKLLYCRYINTWF